MKISVFADSEGRKCTVKEDGIFTDNYSSVWFDENEINYVNEYFSTIKANKAKAFIITESVFLPYEKKFHDLYDYLQEFNVVIFTTQDNSIYDFLADTIRDYFEGCTVLGNIYSVTEEYYANVTEYEEAINALDSATFRILNGEYTHKSWDS